MTQAERFDAQDFADALKRVGVPALKANTYAHEIGLLASEAPERVQCFRDVIYRLADAHASVEAKLIRAEALVESLDQQVNALATLGVPTHKHEAHDWLDVDCGDAYLDASSGCSWHPATSTESEGGDQHRQHQHHMHRN